MGGEETTVPVVARELDDDQAVVAMVDSNLHRENLKPSEKAFAYKMKLNAMKHQGKHLDSGTLAQVGPKFTDGSPLNEKGNNTSTINSNELLARQVGESVAQIKRYIRLTKLIPKILDMVDDGKIAFTIAVELSYLSEDEQYELHAVMDLEQCTPSLLQANRIKRIGQAESWIWMQSIQYWKRKNRTSGNRLRFVPVHLRSIFQMILLQSRRWNL